MNKYLTPQQQREFDDRMMREFLESIESTKGRKLTLGERLECEDLMHEAKRRGKDAAKAARIAEHKCKFCECPVDNDIEHEWRKSLPTHMSKALKSRMAYGFERDVDGEWMHANVWQCILSFQAHHGPLRAPEGYQVGATSSGSDPDNTQEN